MNEYFSLLHEYKQKGNELMSLLCDTLQIPQNEYLYDNLLDRQSEIAELYMEGKWKVRLHGLDIAFISKAEVIQVHAADTHIITASFFARYLRDHGKTDTVETNSFLQQLFEQGKVIKW